MKNSTRMTALTIILLVIALATTAPSSLADPVQVIDIWSGSLDSNPEQLLAMGDQLYFVASDPVSFSQQLFRSDGTVAGTYPITALSGLTGPYHLTAVGSTLYFIMSYGFDHQLWKSDGTMGSEEMVSDAWLYTNRPNGLTAVGNRLFFAADDGSGIHGRELWVSDGTDAGTVMVKDCYPDSGSSSPEYLLAMDGYCFFVAYHLTGGRELWRSDGTAAGTDMVLDSNPGLAGASFTEPEVMDGILYYQANGMLWRSDGTGPGTWEVFSELPGSLGPIEITAMNGILYFQGADNEDGTELWRSDGTYGGTYQLRDIRVGPQSSLPWYLVAVGNTLYFRATDSVYGNELMKSDGTYAGTVVVADIISGDGSYPEHMTALGEKVYFRVNDGINGTELWSSDGTAGGTAMVADLNGGSGSSTPEFLTVAGDKLYFRAYVPGVGKELCALFNTIDGSLTCVPSSGTLPFSTTMTMSLINAFSGQTRRVAAGIDVTLAGGAHYPNWRFGYTNIGAGATFARVFPVNLPQLPPLAGDNIFTLVYEDVTPAPYNQPPYPPAGDNGTDAEVVTGVLP